MKPLNFYLNCRSSEGNLEGPKIAGRFLHPRNPLNLHMREGGEGQRLLGVSWTGETPLGVSCMGETPWA